jgi:hypothetical protein
MDVTHLALVAMDQERVVAPVENRDERRADDVLGDVIERLLVSWDAELLFSVSANPLS